MQEVESEGVKIASATLPLDQNESPTDWTKIKVENPIE
jgi:hypothetical protein